MDDRGAGLRESVGMPMLEDKGVLDFASIGKPQEFLRFAAPAFNNGMPNISEK